MYKFLKWKKKSSKPLKTAQDHIFNIWFIFSCVVRMKWQGETYFVLTKKLKRGINVAFWEQKWLFGESGFLGTQVAIKVAFRSEKNLATLNNIPTVAPAIKHTHRRINQRWPVRPATWCPPTPTPPPTGRRTPAGGCRPAGGSTSERGKWWKWSGSSGQVRIALLYIFDDILFSHTKYLVHLCCVHFFKEFFFLLFSSA